jgi:hypothetical protein
LHCHPLKLTALRAAAKINARIFIRAFERLHGGFMSKPREDRIFKCAR